MVIVSYYTGARPNEILRLRSKDIKRENNYVVVQVEGSKGGLPRPIYLRYKKPMVKELYKYCQALNPERFLFFHFRGSCQKKRIKKDGTIYFVNDSSYKLYYHFTKWFDILPMGTISPYYLRHNRFSAVSQKGGSMEDIRMLKGSKTLASVEPYLHMSTERAKKIARFVD